MSWCPRSEEGRVLANLAGASTTRHGRSAERADDDTTTFATAGAGALLHDRRRSHSARIL